MRTGPRRLGLRSIQQTLLRSQGWRSRSPPASHGSSYAGGACGLRVLPATFRHHLKWTQGVTMSKALFCPTCRKVVLATDENFPFCSDRCRILDLGKWASGDYKVSSPIQDPDDLEELARATAHRRHNSDDEA